MKATATKIFATFFHGEAANDREQHMDESLCKVTDEEDIENTFQKQKLRINLFEQTKLKMNSYKNTFKTWEIKI